jgi:ABC-2 type transport system permease protein
MPNPVAMQPMLTSCPAARYVSLCWVGFTTFLIRAGKDILNNFILTIAPAAITTALYFIVFGTFIGQRVGTIGGLDYAQFISPGLVILPVISGSYSQAGLSFVVAKILRNIDEHLISPQPSWNIVASYVAGGALRGVIVGLTAEIITMVFTGISIEHAFITIAILLLVSVVSASAGFINGILAMTLEQVNSVATFVLTPLTYLGGVFYSVSLLPIWAQKLSRVNPLFYLVSLFRYCMFGASDVSVWAVISALLLAVFIMFAAATALIRRGIGIKD